MMFGYRPRTALAIIEHLGSAAAFFDLPSGDAAIITERLAGRPSREAFLDKALQELEITGKKGYHFIGITDECYPFLLRQCPDAPVGLYIRSASAPEKLFRRTRHLAVVGTRNMTRYGKEWCRILMEHLGKAGDPPAIVSGLAAGVDAEAHRGALENGMPTIAVMATGIDRIYPCMNEYLAGKIEAHPESALISDYPMGTIPKPYNFIRRNRIIAGLSDATVIIESKSRGGSLITARQAFSYDRDVFALPGRVDDACSCGCNALIKEKTASPVLSPSDISENLCLGIPDESTSVPGQENPAADIPATGTENSLTHAILSAIRSEQGITADSISEKTGYPYKTIAANIAMLEAYGIITTDIMQRCFINRHRKNL